MSARPNVLAFVVATALTFIGANAFACSCLRPPPPQDAMNQAAAVFIGEVVGSSPRNDGTVLVDMNVAETFKGDLGTTTAIRTRNNSAACGYNFQNDTTYLVYAFRSNDGELVTSLCSRTTPVANASDEIEQLRAMPPREVAVVEPEESNPDDAPEEPPRDTESKPTQIEPAFGEVEAPQGEEPEESSVIVSGAEQEEGREDIPVPGPESAAISAHAMFRYTLNIDADDSAELYNLRLYLKKSWDDFVFYAEPRFRQTPLRNFSPSNIWIQQAWVGYDFVDGVRLRGGLINTAFSRPWDNSWFGNLPYLNGLKLDPDYGIDVAGVRPLTDWLRLDYSVQWLPASDGLNGFFATTDKLERLEALPGQDVVLDFDSTPGYVERQAFVGRLVPRLLFGDFRAAAGGSVYTSALENTREETGRKFAFGAEAELGWKGASLYGEWVRSQITVDVDSLDWTHLGAGAAYTWNRDARWWRQAQGRVNVTTTAYDREFDFGGTRSADEFFLTLGTYLRVHEMVGFTAEYVLWNFAEDEVVNRIEWILHAYF